MVSFLCQLSLFVILINSSHSHRIYLTISIFFIFIDPSGLLTTMDDMQIDTSSDFVPYVQKVWVFIFRNNYGYRKLNVFLFEHIAK